MTQAVTGPEANSKILDAAMQGIWRMETILHLGGMTGDESLPRALEEALDEDFEEIALAIGLSPKRVADLDKDELLERIRVRAQWGFLVQAATPVRSYVAGGDTCQFSWSSHYTHWFYGEDLCATIPAIEAWVAKCILDDRTEPVEQAA
jgi:hypothetical protein